MKLTTARVTAVAIVALLAACTRIPDDEPIASPSPTPTVSSTPTATTSPAQRRTTAIIYYQVTSQGRSYLAKEKREVLETTPGFGPLHEMLRGRASDPDLSSPWPTDAEILSISFDGGTATVDWSADVLLADANETEERLGIQQAVWTLTELPGVDRVAFRVEGKTKGSASNGRRIDRWWGSVGLERQPFGRADADILEPITIWSPSETETVGHSFVAEGEASTTEAHVGLRLLKPDGSVAKDTFATASEGAPGRGTWRATLTIPPGSEGQIWRLEAYESSLEDGSDSFVQTRFIRIGA